MKTLLLMTLTLSTTSFVKAQEFMPPTEQDLMAASMAMLDSSQAIMTKTPAKDCDNELKMSMKEKEPVIERMGAGQELFCVCELEGLKALKDPKKKKNLGVILGDFVETEMTLNTGNDNFLHGGLQAVGGQAYDGDDRGRTFGGGVDYSLTGTEGQLKVSLDSTLFGKFTTVNGYKKNPDNSYNLVGRERNTLDVRLDKNFSYGDQSKTYLISEFKFSNETDQGSLSRSVQERWHRGMKDAGMYNAIQYKYIKENDDDYTMSALMGVGKKWVSNLGNWKCQTALEAKGGMSVSLAGKASPEVSALASGKVSHSSVPWVALSAWIQGSAGFQGRAVDAGVMLSVEKKVGPVIVKPFIGVEQHRSRIDRKFASDGKSNELYHVLGVTIKY